MKLLLFITLFLGSIISNAEPIKGKATRAERSFNKKFSNAQEVSWTYGKDVIRADFKIANQHASAYYNHDGSLLALTRNIASPDLPLALQLELKNEYEGLWITELFELSNDQGITYYISLENADKRIVLKAQPGQSWSTYKKETKN